MSTPTAPTDTQNRAANRTLTEVRRSIEKEIERIKYLKIPELAGSAQELLNTFHSWRSLLMLLLERKKYLFLLKETFDGSDPNDIRWIDPYYCTGERLDKTYYDLVFKNMQDELLAVLVTSLAQMGTDSALMNILKEHKTPGTLMEALTKVYGKIDTPSISQHLEALNLLPVPTTFQGVIALCNNIDDSKLRLTEAQGKFPDNFFILKLNEKLRQCPLKEIAFQIQLMMHQLQMGTSWAEIKSNMMSWARTMISSQTGYLQGATGGNISYISAATSPPQYYNGGRGQGKGRGRGRGRGRGSRGKGRFTHQPHRPGHYAPNNANGPAHCNKCGALDHFYKDCPLVICTYCGRRGHNATQCYKRKNDNERKSNYRHYPQQHRPQNTQIHALQHQQQQPQTDQQNLDNLFNNNDGSYFNNLDNNRHGKSPRLFTLSTTYEAITNVYKNSSTFNALNNLCKRNGVVLMMVDSGASASVFPADRPSICRESCAATLTGFNGAEQKVKERALYPLRVHASTHDGTLKMEIFVQGFEMHGLKNGIISEADLCKNNHYIRGDILFKCPCLVRIADWHVIKLIEVDNTFWMIVGDTDPSTFLPSNSQTNSRAMWSNIDMKKWQNTKFTTKMHVLRKEHNTKM